MFKKWFVMQYHADDRWYIKKYVSSWGTPQCVWFSQFLGPYKTEEEAVSAYLTIVRPSSGYPMP